MTAKNMYTKDKQIEDPPAPPPHPKERERDREK